MIGALVLSLLVSAPEGRDFIEEVKPLFHLLACDGAPLPANVDAETVARYCKVQAPRFERYRTHWGTDAKAFLARIVPKDLPPELVYPFGGGDLMSALNTFPDAKVITTLSLELAGDPRRLAGVKDKKVLAASLSLVTMASESTLLSNDSKSVNLSKAQRGELPGQLSMHLMGLHLHGYEPISVRYFKIADDGALHYYTEEEIQALEGQHASKLKGSWMSPDFSPAFANVEVQFVPKGSPEGTAPRIHRHIGADLSDAGLTRAPGVLAHLASKGKVAAMTKAASYLLWRDDFAKMRTYLLDHMAFMIADSTGIPPFFCKKAGVKLETYGSFEKSFLGSTRQHNNDLRAEFASQPQRALPFRFGYPDGSPEKRNHMIVYRPAR